MSRDIKLKSIKKNTLSSLVMDEIIKLLIDGKIKPGDKLPSEYELMEMLYVSRAVLREALSALETLGILKRKSREGTYISDKIGTRPFRLMLALSSDDIETIIETRMTQELGFVTLAAEKITEEELQRLETTIYNMSNNIGNYDEMDKEFHNIITSSVMNNVTSGIIEPLMDFFYKVYYTISKEHRNIDITIQQHQAIFEALKDRDPFEAHRAMYIHLDHVRKRVKLGKINNEEN
ncbi:FadR family transcriptional regulator [Oceanobacillus kimchii]|uniref:FadR/GntR family transcriptional regulator n=1 Tax=Oceanobacillus kimchii TaxID=746691 RepID=UPI0021A610DD|nr:FadR/GntR family transcriptional regulator [Oceanobacillus kimchii]MCT1578388.1 FadR family transcriptional regulator [Oceanobacillus kimchii]MCT2134566.1 FadR family transcriptional regulator [Oceanobacillus kimchii]